MAEIRFSRRSPEYSGFSNFSPHAIVLDETEWPTVEHCFQAAKFLGLPYAGFIRSAASPAEARRLGQSRGYPLMPDWYAVKEDVMLEALIAKFEQHPDLAELLLSTGQATLVEDNPHDAYWGCGSDGTGANRMGILLMQVGDRLRESRRDV